MMITEFVSLATSNNNTMRSKPDEITNTTLYLGDLSRFCTESLINKLFSTVGEVVEVKIIMDQDTKVPLGYGFVKMLKAVDAQMAMTKFNNDQLCGRPLRIKWATRNLKNDCCAQRHNDSTSDGSAINSIHVRFRVLKVIRYYYYLSLYSLISI